MFGPPDGIFPFSRSYSGCSGLGRGLGRGWGSGLPNGLPNGLANGSGNGLRNGLGSGSGSGLRNGLGSGSGSGLRNGLGSGLRSGWGGLGGLASASFKTGTAAVEAEINATIINHCRFGAECT
jgi:hypothetical protein